MIRALINASKDLHPYAESGCKDCQNPKVWRGYCEDCPFNYSKPIEALEEREGFQVADRTLDFVFRLFELNRRLELTGDLIVLPLSDIEKEGLFILRDESKKFEAAEMIRLRKQNG